MALQLAWGEENDALCAIEDSSLYLGTFAEDRGRPPPTRYEATARQGDQMSATLEEFNEIHNIFCFI